MTPDTECARVRLQLMAVIDREIDAASSPDRDHLSGCSSCQQWVHELEALHGRLRGLAYPDTRGDLWALVESRIRDIDAQPDLRGRLWIVASLVFGWRALQLLIDLPLPALHPLVPLAAGAAALWLLAGDPLAVKTFAPELEKRGV